MTRHQNITDCLLEGCGNIFLHKRVDEVFGEMGILDNMPRSATAVCLTDCTVLVVKPENFMMFFEKKPAVILQLLQRMCIQVRDLTEKYLKVCKTFEEMESLEDKDQVVKLFVTNNFVYGLTKRILLIKTRNHL